MHGARLVNDFGDLMVHTITENGILSLNSETLKFWNDSKSGVKVATLEDEDFPDFIEVKGMSVTENQVTLILDDEKFVVFRRETTPVD